MNPLRDPSIALCLVKNSFDKNEVDIEAIKPESYSSINIEDDIELSIEKISTSSSLDSMVGGYEDLQDLKKQLSGVDISIIKSVNPFESIGKSIFMSRESIKLTNIDAVYQLSGGLWNIHSMQTESVITFCDISGGPGAFSQYLFWRHPNSIGYGITLRNNSGKLDWKVKNKNFTPYYGPDDTGDLYSNWNNFRDFILEKHDDGVDLAVANGVFDDEFKSSKILTIELYLGISCVNHHGNFVCKVFDTVNKYTYDLIYLLSLAYNDIIMFKPMSSRPADAERYIVCIDRKRNVDKVEEAFEKVINSFSNEQFVKQIFDTLPEDYTLWMDKYNNISINRQKYYINNILDVVRKKEVEIYVYNNNKALILWSLPGNVENIPEGTKKVKDSLLSINHDEINLYEYIDLDEFMNSKYSKEFPYKRLYYSDEQVLEMFQRLKEYNWRDNMQFFNKKNAYVINNLNIDSMHLKYKGVQQAIINKVTDYLEFNLLSDMFEDIESSRLQTIVYGTKESSWDYYFNNTKEIAQYSLGKDYKITPHTLREALYSIHKEATSFRPNLVVAIARMFNVSSMLDFSAGWGDRMIGAMASNISYIGFDPNERNVKGYNNIIKFFSSRPELKIDPNKYKIITSPFEDADISNVENVDLVMTSPPYFNLEIYSSSDTQSTSRYSSEDEWLNNFLLVSIDKSISKLNDGGYLVLVINQKDKKENYITKMISYVNTKLEYLGIIAYGMMKQSFAINRPQPMWIWRKGYPNLFLQRINRSMKFEITRIVKDADNMKNVGTAKPWSNEKIVKFINYQEKDDNNYYYWRGIQVDGRIEGIIGIHPVSYSDGYFVTIFISKYSTKRGYGSTALEYIIEDFKEDRTDVSEIFADVLRTNIPAQKLFISKGFDKTGRVDINRKEYVRFSLTLRSDVRLSYLTKFEVLSEKVYDERLSDWEKLGLIEINKRGFANLVATEGKYSWDKELYNIRADLKYRIDANNMTNKIDLHDSLSGLDIIPETYVIYPNIEIDIEDTGTWIWRPEGEFGGTGIFILDSQDDLIKVRKKFGNPIRNNRAIISRYIPNPMLIDGKKFHLHIFFFVFVDNNVVKTFVGNYGRIAVANKPFIMSNFDDKDIHDTHLGEMGLFYPDDFPYADKIDSIDTQIDDILAEVTTVIGPSFRKYDESKAGYEIFGCDFMIDDNDKVILIEINFKPGFMGLNKEKRELMSNYIGNGIIDTIIDPYFNIDEPKYDYAAAIKEVNIK